MKPLGVIHTVRWQRASTRTHVVLDYFTQHLPPSLSPPQKILHLLHFRCAILCGLRMSMNLSAHMDTPKTK